MRSQVTTKRGDAGETVTLGGDTYPKSHPILECCGVLDTLRAETALARAQLLDSGRPDAGEWGDVLLWLLHTYFSMGSQCNDPLNKHPEYRKRDLTPAHLDRLEAEQARLEASMKLPKAFIVSASNALSAQFDVACTAVRTFERSVVRLKETVPEFDTTVILPFVNRLSDFLYLLARRLEDGHHLTVDYDVLK